MLKVPAIDIAEVGAGAGSIAWIDDGGLLRVGPESTGSRADGPREARATC
jgi:N-methylhydantoinase A